jgi:ACS family pantothenate transporter-like MFS transporter
MVIASYPANYMNLWLKSEGFSVTQINQLPTVASAITIVASWLGTSLVAVYPSWVIYSIVEVFLLFGTLCMIIWDIPQGLK